MKRLRLYLEPEWNVSLPLPWVLLDAGNSVLAEGNDKPEQWPAVKISEVILSAGSTLFTQVTLPKKVRRLTTVMLGYALEEGLINEPSTNLYALGENLPDGTRAVAVTEGEPIKQLIVMLKKMGIACEYIVPEEALLPMPPEAGWSIARNAKGYLVRFSSALATWFPRCTEEVETRFWQQLLLLGAPSKVVLCGDSAPLWLNHHIDNNQSEAVVHPAHHWQTGKINTLYDFSRVFSRYRDWRTGLAIVRRCMYAVAALMVLALLITLVQVGWYAWESDRLSSDMQAQMAPWVKSKQRPLTITDFRQAVDELRHTHGLSQYSSALVLMAALASVAGENLQLDNLHYEDGRLKVGLFGTSESEMTRWQQTLKKQGILLDRAGKAGRYDLVLSLEP